MARKLSGFQRVLDAPALFSVAYGEIASSIYFALGIVAAYALGFTPLVLLAGGLFFLLVSLSYAEGTAAIPETGGAATFVRRAFNDVFGFLTGWALFLDYLIVIALSTLFLPHYLGTAIGVEALRDSPWDAVTAVGVIVAIAGVRLARRSQLHAGGIVVAALDLATQLLLVILGLALLFSPDVLTNAVSLGSSPAWSDIAFALPLAMLAYTGPRDGGEPGRGDARAGADASAQPLLGDRARRGADRADRRRRAVRIPRRERRDGAGGGVAQAPLVGIVEALQGSVPDVARRHAPRLRRAHRRARAARGGDDVDLRVHPPRPLARRAQAASAELRAAEPADARLAAGDRRGRGDLDRARARHRGGGRPGGLPREPLLVRRSARLRGGAAGRAPAARHRARPAASLPCASRGSADRCAARDRGLGARARDPSRGPVRRPGVARARARGLSARPPQGARRGSCTRGSWPSFPPV